MNKNEQHLSHVFQIHGSNQCQHLKMIFLGIFVEF